MALITNNISGSIADSSKIGITGSIIISNDAVFPVFPGTDVVFFVSGSTDGTNKSSFGGDLIVSGAMSIGGDSLEVTGTIAATLGFSGSLTQLVDGTSYLLAGTNITITSASNGAITIGSTAGGSPGGAINEIQYNGGGVFTGSINFTFDGTNACLTGSFSQGNNSRTLGGNSHAEGNTTLSVGGDSHSEGGSTTAGFLGYLSNDISTSEQDKIYLDSSYGNVVASFSGGQTAIIHDSLYDNSIKYLTAYVNGVSWNGTNTVLDFVGVTTIPFTSTAIIGVVGNPTPSGADQIMGQGSHAEGSGTLTIGYYSHAEGATTVSSGQYSHAEGDATVASGEYSHAEGGSGGGGQLVASGDYSHAEGYNTTASGLASHAEGENTIARGDYSHAEGLGTIASGSYQHVGGKYNLRNNDYSLYVVGNGTGDDDTLRSDILRVNTDSVQITGSIIQLNSGSSTIGFMGNQVGSSPSIIGSDVFFYISGSNGYDVTVIGGDLVVSGTLYGGSPLKIGNDLQVTGSLTTTLGFSGSLTTLVDGTSYLIAGTNITITSASNGSVTIDAAATSPGGSDTEIQYNSGGSFAGSSNFTYNGTAVFLTGSFSQGYAAVVSGTESHAEGFQTTASGDYSHAEGRATTASGDFSHAEGGTGTTASGDFSHAEGDGAVASGTASHAEGDNTLAQGAYSHAEGNSTIALGIYSHAEGGTGGGGQLIASGAYSHAEGYNTIAYAAGTHAEGWSAKAGALGYHSTSISSGVITLDASYGDLTSTGIGTIVDGMYIVLNDYAYDNNYSSAIYKVDTSVYGTNTVLTLFDLSVSTTEAVVGVAGLATPTAADFPLGQFSHAEGYSTVAMGINSHAEGNGSTASSNFSHAEGEGTNTRGIASHAEGASVLASGDYSHAEGVGSHAFGYASHSEGLETIASGSYQHVGGQYNTRGNNFSLFVIGNGTSDLDADRSDILRVNTDSVQVSGSLVVSGAYIHNVVSGTTAPNYAVGTWDHVIVFSNNVVTATLPSAAPIGRKLIFKDGTGAASTAGGQMLSCSLGAIDGSSTYTMASVNYTAVSVIKINDPDEWIIV